MTENIILQSINHMQTGNVKSFCNRDKQIPLVDSLWFTSLTPIIIVIIHCRNTFGHVAIILIADQNKFVSFDH